MAAGQDTTTWPPCPLNENFSSCVTCEASCSLPFPTCTASVCAAKCQCNPGYARANNGTCVMMTMCSQTGDTSTTSFGVFDSTTTTTMVPMPGTVVVIGESSSTGMPTLPTSVFLDSSSTLTSSFLTTTSPITQACPPDETYGTCVGCEATCASPVAICPLSACVARCTCNFGFVRSLSGGCIPLLQCALESTPMATETMATTLLPVTANVTATTLMPMDTTTTLSAGLTTALTTILGNNATTTQVTCTTNEMFSSCVRCEATCANLFPVCLDAPCIARCSCFPGLVRSTNNTCITVADCAIFANPTVTPPGMDGASGESTTVGLILDTTTAPFGAETTTIGLSSESTSMTLVAETSTIAFNSETTTIPTGLETTTIALLTGATTIPQCPQNEAFNTCARCEPTCGTPFPVCTDQSCRQQCQCLSGLVRYYNGTCVPLDSCFAATTSALLATTPAVSMDTPVSTSLPPPMCPPNEGFNSCVSCEPTCDSPIPTCPGSPCTAKCQCNASFVRSSNSTCIPLSSCPFATGTTTLPPAAGAGETLSTRTPGICPTNEHFDECVRCEANCSRPFPICTSEPCVQKCTCDDGYARNPAGVCVTLTDCVISSFSEAPPNETISDASDGTTPFMFTTFPTIGGTTPPLPGCPPNETYQQCVRCEGTCAVPLPLCFNDPCVSRCMCNFLFLRSASGSCIPWIECLAPENRPPRA